MEQLPIRLSFFRKLELYQKLKAEDYRQKTTDRLQIVWFNEKKILEWTKGHHLRGISIGVTFVKRHILEDAKLEIIRENLKNLVQKGYAIKESCQNLNEYDYEYEILFTQDGMLMGEVINDIKTFWGKLKFEFFYCVTWTVVYLFVLTIILNFIKYFVLILIKPTIF